MYKLMEHAITTIQSKKQPNRAVSDSCLDRWGIGRIGVKIDRIKYWKVKS